ncbi:MAG: amidohydrolase family protein [Candidatus Dormibacteraeota bacterium]|nr:amidohydrolase family protein [Candidatus Dormibacteraeota bacterium]MBO0760774.1 amidohydrolase family protein [Candidatus Dormibacteraeota bacterium]
MMQFRDDERFDTRQLLQHAAQQADERGFRDFLIVDVDCHHYETESFVQVAEYIEDPIVRHNLQSSLRKGAARPGVLPSQIGDQDMGGRVTRYPRRGEEVTEAGAPRDVQLVHRYQEQLGIDYSVLFPTPMLNLGMHPQTDVEVALARAYARWMTEEVLPHSRTIRTMLYLPFNDPEESLRLIRDFGSSPNVVGFLVTSVRQVPVHHNRYVPVYTALSELGLPLAFHAAYDWTNGPVAQLNKFISVHALGFPLYNMIHLTNFVINGVAARFPDLKVLWIEGGLSYIPFLMQRLDNEYMMRSSEAPLLTKLPSDYMRDFYWSSQPLEATWNPRLLEEIFRMLDASNRLLYASDYPHWDFDTPSVIYDLPFLDEQAKRRILGLNAAELFGLPTEGSRAASDDAAADARADAFDGARAPADVRPTEAGG